jgi:hypothetical protein
MPGKSFSPSFDPPACFQPVIGNSMPVCKILFFFQPDEDLGIEKPVRHKRRLRLIPEFNFLTREPRIKQAMGDVGKRRRSHEAL